MTQRQGDIRSLYVGARVLVTGASGFVGKVLIESLLRKTEVDKIYVLIRSKRDKSVEERLKEILTDKIFLNLNERRPGRLSAIVPVAGDIALPELGLSPEDEDLLAAEVEMVFHIAATVRFTENLKLAAEINVRGTKLLMDLARKMANLKVVMHVSTAYVKDFLNEVDEKIYPNEQVDILKLTDAINKEIAHNITKGLLGGSANTYVYTKRIAEYLIQKDYKDLPVGILRPGIVISAVKEPLPGYLDNKYGPTGVGIAMMDGLMHCLAIEPSARAELVPVDFVTNSLIASAWDTYNRYKLKEEDIPVYNVVPGQVAPVHWRDYLAAVMREGKRAATSSGLWHVFCFPAPTWRRFQAMSLLFHHVPAFLVDHVLPLFGKKPRLAMIATGIDKTMEVLIPFSFREWVFHSPNLWSLWKKMSKEEQELFPFTFDCFNWESYLDVYMKGIKEFMMKETISKKEAKQKAVRHFIHHWCLVTTILVIFFSICIFLFLNVSHIFI